MIKVKYASMAYADPYKEEEEVKHGGPRRATEKRELIGGQALRGKESLSHEVTK